MELLIIIPTYNERENIVRIIEETYKYLPHAHILVVDDNSPDGTAEIVSGLQKSAARFAQRLFMLQRKGKEGLGKAYIHAFQYALSEFKPKRISMMDADLSHHPRFLVEMENVYEPKSVIVGSRYVPGGSTVGWEPWRRGLSYFGNIYARTITGIPVNDLTAGFYLFDASLLQDVDLEEIASSGYAFQIELKNLLYQSGARFKEVPIVFENRVGGESKISNHIISEGIIAPWNIRFRKK